MRPAATARRRRWLAELAVIVLACVAAAPLIARQLPASWPFVWVELAVFLVPALALGLWRAWVHQRAALGGKRPQLSRHEGWALGAMLIGLVCTAAVVGWLEAQRAQLAAVRFTQLASQLDTELQARFQRPLQALKGLQALHAVQNGLRRLEFARWVAAYGGEASPSVFGLGFVERVSSDRLAAYIARQRDDDAPIFDVRGRGPAADLYVVSFVEPLASNRAAWGLDMGRDAPSRQAFEAALRSGVATLSKLIALPHRDGTRPGLLLILPVHDAESDLRTEGSRLASTAGFLYAAIALDRLLAPTAAQSEGLVAFELVDSSGPQPHVIGPASPGSRPGEGATVLERPLTETGLPLALRVWATPAFAQSQDPGTSFGIGVLGALLSGLTGLIVWLVTTDRQRATRLAARMTAELRLAAQEAEAARRDKDQLLDTMNQHCIVSMTDPSGRIIFCNDAFIEISGYSRDELMGQQHRIINSGMHPPAFWADFWSTLRAGRLWQGELCNRAKDGRLYWVKSSVAPFFNARGEVERFVAVRTDVSAEHEAREALMSMNQRFAIALEGGNDGLWDWLDTHSQAMWWSPQFFRLLGHEPGTLESSIAVFDSLLHPDDQPHTLATLAAALKGQGEYDVEFRLRCRDGSYRWFRSRAKVFRDGQDEHCRMAGSLQDIDEFKAIQARLRTRNAEMSAILAASPDAYVSLDARGRINFTSPALGRLTGSIQGELIGCPLAQLLDRLAELGSFGHANSPEQRLVALRGAGLMLETTRGQRRALSLRLHAAGADSDISELLLIRDITQQVELEQIKSEFLSTAAHELRTPMASIFGFTEILMMRELPAERRQAFLAKIHRQAQSMMHILNELLDLARIEARRGKDFDLQVQRLDDIVREAVQDFQPPDGREPPVLALPDSAAWARVDRAKLLQVLRNLLSNAYKYSPGGGPVELRLGAGPPEGSPWLRLDVQDHGIGMTPDQLARVTERFYRADTTGAIAGTGLGMSIVKEIVELQGGRLELASEPGRGSCISVLLPGVEDAAASDARAA